MRKTIQINALGGSVGFVDVIARARHLQNVSRKPDKTDDDHDCDAADDDDDDDDDVELQLYIRNCLSDIKCKQSMNECSCRLQQGRGPELGPPTHVGPGPGLAGRLST